MKLHAFTVLALALAAIPAHGQADAPADSVYEASDVTTLPRPLNVPEFTEAMNRVYPQPLREIGVPGTVQVRFVIGKDGAPRDFEVTASSAGFLVGPAVEALSVLRFSPAERDGRRVAMWAELPVRWQATAGDPASGDTARIYDLGEVDSQPRPSNVTHLIRVLERLYPPALRDAGVHGEVTVGMRVSPEGVPQSFAIIEASDPRFIEPTVAATRELRFEPARVAGQPVWVWVVLPINWTMGGTVFANPEGRLDDGRRPVALRPAIRNPEVVQAAIAEGARELAAQSPRWGRVVVRLRVGVDGLPDDVRVVETADRKLNEASIRVVRQMRFTPATVNGRPVPVPIQLPIDWTAP